MYCIIVWIQQKKYMGPKPKINFVLNFSVVEKTIVVDQYGILLMQLRIHIV